MKKIFFTPDFSGTNWGMARGPIGAGPKIAFLYLFFFICQLQNNRKKAHNPNTGWTNEDRYP